MRRVLTASLPFELWTDQSFELLLCEPAAANSDSSSSSLKIQTELIVLCCVAAVRLWETGPLIQSL